MPAPDGDIYVSPVYLAGSTHTGDPALQPLLDQDFRLHRDDLGNVYVSSPEQHIRLGYLPEGEDSTLWKIAVHSDPFGPPRWVATFDNATPTELVAVFTTALAQDYQRGHDTYLYGNTSRATGFQPLIDAGWQTGKTPHVSVSTPPDGLAELAYANGSLDHQSELSGDGERWIAWGGRDGYGSRWWASFTTHTPAHLIAATMTALADPTPVARCESEVPNRNRGAARVTPVEPPVPTPLDVRRASAARSRSTTPRPFSASPATPAQRPGACLSLPSSRRR
ncbi:DUF317 domain-containing protein [Streptomyces sp. H27-D2]|uniref:DUF317 domain-containing protein n=1 Tax=Streptomyces sp. H27-D2 TaxID=3046304 RepID=UPI002DB6A96A|nr:DUF317 domain-containing protein [Streptomyces sp. H27-D2]MEC4018285.1 DUF317 domain-containing protein [Streptomyces sp. H27-D2]